MQEPGFLRQTCPGVSKGSQTVDNRVGKASSACAGPWLNRGRRRDVGGRGAISGAWLRRRCDRLRLRSDRPIPPCRCVSANGRFRARGATAIPARIGVRNPCPNRCLAIGPSHGQGGQFAGCAHAPLGHVRRSGLTSPLTNPPALSNVRSSGVIQTTDIHWSACPMCSTESHGSLE